MINKMSVGVGILLVLAGCVGEEEGATEVVEGKEDMSIYTEHAEKVSEVFLDTAVSVEELVDEVKALEMERDGEVDRKWLEKDVRVVEVRHDFKGELIHRRERESVVQEHDEYVQVVRVTEVLWLPEASIQGEAFEIQDYITESFIYMDGVWVEYERYWSR